MPIPQSLHEEYTEIYSELSSGITKLSWRLPAVLAMASAFPLYTNIGSADSRSWLTLGLALSGVAGLIEYLRNHLNLKHIEIILHEHQKYRDFYFNNTWWGSVADKLFWFRGIVLGFSGGFIIYGIYLFRSI